MGSPPSSRRFTFLAGCTPLPMPHTNILKMHVFSPKRAAANGTLEENAPDADHGCSRRLSLSIQTARFIFDYEVDTWRVPDGGQADALGSEKAKPLKMQRAGGCWNCIQREVLTNWLVKYAAPGVLCKRIPQLPHLERIGRAKGPRGEPASKPASSIQVLW